MADQFDLLALLSHPAAPPAVAPAPPPRAAIVPPPRACGCPPGRVCRGYVAHALRQVCPATITVLSGIAVLREEGEDRLALDSAGWTMAMLHRDSLVREQLARTIAPGDAEVLAVLSRLQLAWAGLARDGAVLVHPDALEPVHDMLAGLRCAAQPADRNLKLTWTAQQGWIVYDAFVVRDTRGAPSVPALFEAGDGPGAADACHAWIAANEQPVREEDAIA